MISGDQFAETGNRAHTMQRSRLTSAPSKRLGFDEVPFLFVKAALSARIQGVFL